MMNQWNFHLYPGFQGQSFIWKGSQWCWITPYAIYRGTRTPTVLLRDEWKCSATSVSWPPAGGSVSYTSDCCQNRGWCFEDQVEELERLYMLMETGNCDLESLLESDCVRKIHNTLTVKKNELARTSKTSKLWVNYEHMLGIARALVAADRMGSWKMHLSAISACLQIFAAAGHPNYLQSAHLYLQKMYALKDDNPEVHPKFQFGFHVIRRSSHYWAFLGSDLVIKQTLMRSLKSQRGADARKWDVRAPENSLGHVFHCVIRLQPCRARTYREKLHNR